MNMTRIALRTGPSYPALRSMARSTALPPLSERRFQQQILDLAHLHGWLTYHTWSSMHSASGFPDLVLVRKERLIFAELKTDSSRSKLSVNQQLWFERLSATCAEVYVWRPRDFPDVVRVLQ